MSLCFFGDCRFNSVFPTSTSRVSGIDLWFPFSSHEPNKPYRYVNCLIPYVIFELNSVRKRRWAYTPYILLISTLYHWYVYMLCILFWVSTSLLCNQLPFFDRVIKWVFHELMLWIRSLNLFQSKWSRFFKAALYQTFGAAEQVTMTCRKLIWQYFLYVQQTQQC